MLKIIVDTAQLDRALQAVGKALDDPTEVLNDVGVYLLSEVRLNFEELSRRGSGVDGTKWKEHALSTAITKAEKGGWRPSDREDKDENQNIFQVLKKVQSGRYTEKQNPPKSQIGVDTGLLRNSSVPGFKGDGEGGNLFEVDLPSASVTVGFARSYAKYFDKERPLIPAEAPKDWQVADAAQDVGVAASVAGDQAADGLAAAERAADQTEGGLREVGDAADAAMAEIEEGAKGAAGGLDEVTLNAKKADESLAAAAVNATDLRRRLSDAAKEMSEGISRATEIAVRTGDAKEAALALAEGASKAVTAFNPMVGALAMAVTHAARMTKELWQSSVAAKQAAEAMNVGGIVKDRFQLDEDVLMGYDALKGKIGALTTSIKTYDNAIEDLKKKQGELVDAGKGSSPAYKEAHDREQELYEAKKRMQHELGISQEALDIAKKNRDAEGGKRWEEYNRKAQEIFDSEKKQAEFEKLSRKEIMDLQDKLAIKLQEVNGDEEKSREILEEMESLQQRRIELTKRRAEEEKKADEEARKSRDEEAKRQHELEREMERIHNLEIKALEEEDEKHEDLLRKYNEVREALANKNLTQEEQNDLLKEAERLAQKRIDLDKKDREDAKKAHEETRQRQADERTAADEAKRKWAETQEGRMAAAAASDPEAVARRYAQQTGRRVGTVKQMMRRGEISQTELDLAGQANFDEMYKKRQESGGGGQQLGNTLGRQNDATGSVMRRQDEMERWLAEVDARTKAMYDAARQREEQTRRRRAGSH